jgi:hypothetical protein
MDKGTLPNLYIDQVVVQIENTLGEEKKGEKTG